MMKALLAAMLCAGWALHDIGPAHAQSQAYPNKPIKMVVPFPAGGSVDVLTDARAACQEAGAKPCALRVCRRARLAFLTLRGETARRDHGIWGRRRAAGGGWRRG